MAEIKYIAFGLGDQRYGITLSKINGIEQVYHVVPVPMGAEYIKGIIHLRDEVIPVYDLKKRFGIADIVTASDDRQLLLAETHGMKLGIEVDSVLGIVEVNDTDVKKVPTVVRSEETDYLENIVRMKLPAMTNQDVVLSVSVDRIMTEQEFDSVSNALADAQGSEE